MNIALFTDSYLPTRDGVVSSILAYRQGLQQRGHRMLVFAPELEGAKKEPGVFRYASVKFPPYPEYRAAIFPHVSSSLAKKMDIGLVHCKAMTTMGLSAAWFSRRARLPSIASLETMIPDGVHYIMPIRQAEGLGKAAAWAYLRFLYSNFDLVTAPSRHIQKLLKEHGVDAEILPSPVDTDRFKPMHGAIGMKKKLGLTGKKVVLSVGRLVKEKNYSFLLRVAKKMEKEGAVFVLVGRGPYLEELRREVAAAGLSDLVRFTGFVQDEDMAGYYNAADAFVFPSHFETQGLTLLEAFACGKPACVLEGTPMSENISEGKNGYTFREDEADCAEKLAKCLQRPERMAEAARKSALEYSIPKCTERLLGMYGKLLK
jgi:1,2-diacylglycerol 3-alpha-glucosyltransferase